MDYDVCHVCKNFRQYYKYDNFKLVEASAGECKLFPFCSCDRPDCDSFEVWEVHKKSLVRDIYPYIENINDSVEFLKQYQQFIEENVKNTP